MKRIKKEEKLIVRVTKSDGCKSNSVTTQKLKVASLM